MSAPQRPAVLRLWLDGVALEQLGDSVLSIEVDERSDEASTARVVVDMSPIATGPDAGDWDALEYGDFASARGLPAFRLLSRLTVQLGFEAVDTSAGSGDVATVFDGYVTAVEPVFGENRVPDSYLVLHCLDASCLMHLETVTRQWEDVTDAQIAAELFGKYGFTATVGDTVQDGGLVRDAVAPGLAQRGTDAELLRVLARRNGFEWYVEAAAGPVQAGPHPGTGVVGHFHAPRVDAPEQPALSLFPRTAPTLRSFRARYDSHQPTRIRSWHIDERSRLLQTADLVDTDLLRMGSHSRGDVVAERLGVIRPVRAAAAVAVGSSAGEGRPATIDIASGNVPHTAAEVLALARASLRMADWFVTGTGTVQCDRYGTVIRPRRPVTVAGTGHLLDGRWYVQGVRHRWAVDPDAPEQEQRTRRYEADVTLVRNALGGPA